MDQQNAAGDTATTTQAHQSREVLIRGKVFGRVQCGSREMILAIEQGAHRGAVNMYVDLVSDAGRARKYVGNLAPSTARRLSELLFAAANVADRERQGAQAPSRPAAVGTR